jgi:hypothetical protein
VRKGIPVGERKEKQGRDRKEIETRARKKRVRSGKKKTFRAGENEMSAHEKGKRWAVSRFILWLVDGGKEQDIAEIFSAAVATAGSYDTDIEGSLYIGGVLAGWQAGTDQLGLLAALAPDEATA